MLQTSSSEVFSIDHFVVDGFVHPRPTRPSHRTLHWSADWLRDGVEKIV